jgi:hypothetical protein
MVSLRDSVSLEAGLIGHGFGPQSNRIGMRATCGDDLISLTRREVENASSYARTALGSERLPQYLGEHRGSCILVRVLTGIDSLDSGNSSAFMFRALTTLRQINAQMASVGDGP